GPGGQLGRGAGGVHAGRLDGLQLRELLERRFAQPLVTAHGPHLASRLTVLVEDGGLDRQDLALEAALLPGLDGVLLAPQAEAIGVLARDAVLLRDHFRALELRGEGTVIAIAPRQRR